MKVSVFSSQLIKRAARLAMAGVMALGLGTGVQSFAPTNLVSSAHAQARGPVSVADLADDLLGAVVNISTTQKVEQRRPNLPIPQVPDGSPFQDFFDDLFPDGNRNQAPQRPGPRNATSLGSGFVIDASGIIITNNHVIAEADEITVNFADGSKLKAEIVGRDPKTDIAVLKVEPESPLQAVPFGNSDKARIGDWVMAIGNPFGLSSSVSLGIVSAIGRDINSGPYDNFIQTDAAINRGNSGGPLFNMSGEVVGINTAIISPSGGSIGIGFSIPSNLATKVIAQLREFGETRRGWLGVQIQSVSDEIAESLGLDESVGALVSGVVNGGPAEKSGIKTGDVILEFDGQQVENMRDLPRIVADTPVEKTVDVIVLRKGERETVKVTLGRLEDGEKELVSAESSDDKKDAVTATVLGLTVQELTDEIREASKIGEDIKGVIITEVQAGSHAEEKGIKAGEIIVQVGQEPVETPDEMQKQVAALEKDGRKSALLMVSSSSGNVRFAPVRIE